MIDGFNFSYFDKPIFQILRRRYQNSMAMILSLPQHLKNYYIIASSKQILEISISIHDRSLGKHAILKISNFVHTVFKSSIRVITPIAISRRSAGVSGHGYNVARNPSQIFFTLVFNWSPWKNIMKTDFNTLSPCEFTTH